MSTSLYTLILLNTGVNKFQGFSFKKFFIDLKYIYKTALNNNDKKQHSWFFTKENYRKKLNRKFTNWNW